MSWTPEQLHAGALHRLGEDECYFRHGEVVRATDGGPAVQIQCAGRLMAMHFPIPKQTLKKRHVFEAAGVSWQILVADARNGVRGCEAHHTAVDVGGLLIPRECWPVRFVAFVDQFNLDHVVDRLQARRERTATRVWHPASAPISAAWRP